MTGGTLAGKAVTGSLRARAHVENGKPEHVNVTLGSTVHLRLLNRDMTVPTLVYRTTQGGFPYLYQDAWSSQNETTCPVWDQGSDSCAADNTFIAQPSQSVDLAPTSSTQQVSSVAAAAPRDRAVARLN